MYLLDTNILSNALRQRPSPALLLRMQEVPIAEQCTSSITVAELLFGAIRLGDGGTRLLRLIERVVLANFTVSSFDLDAAQRYAELRTYLESAGTTIGHADIQIAAIALATDCVLVTDNLRHFQRVPGLVIENWLER